MNKLRVVQDSCYDSPREWDNLGTMICFHKRYDLGDKHNYSVDDYNSWEEMEKAILKEEGKGTIILPLYLYDHSGVSISTGSFSCRWDSGQVGFIIADKKKILQEFGGKILTKKTKEKVVSILESEVSTYSQYLEGEVYGFIIEDEEGEQLDSCFGFYGNDFAINGMLDYIDASLLGVEEGEVVRLLEEADIEY
jgi:hypothetical protein